MARFTESGGVKRGEEGEGGGKMERKASARLRGTRTKIICLLVQRLEPSPSQFDGS